LILDDERLISCQINPHTARCVTGTSLLPSVSGGASDETGEEKEDLKIGEFFGSAAHLPFPIE
jgi:hypothetical protein